MPGVPLRDRIKNEKTANKIEVIYIAQNVSHGGPSTMLTEQRADEAEEFSCDYCTSTCNIDSGCQGSSTTW